MLKNVSESLDNYGEWRGLRLLSQKENEEMIVFFINEKNHIVFELELKEHTLKNKVRTKVYEVMMLSLERIYQGFGVGALFYREILHRIGIVIMTGDTQSVGARKLWAELNLMPDIVVLVGKRGIPLQEVESDLELGELYSNEFEVYDNDCVGYAFAI